VWIEAKALKDLGYNFMLIHSVTYRRYLW